MSVTEGISLLQVCQIQGRELGGLGGTGGGVVIVRRLIRQTQFWYKVGKVEVM